MFKLFLFKMFIFDEKCLIKLTQSALRFKTKKKLLHSVLAKRIIISCVLNSFVSYYFHYTCMCTLLV